MNFGTLSKRVVCVLKELAKHWVASTAVSERRNCKDNEMGIRHL